METPAENITEVPPVDPNAETVEVPTLQPAEPDPVVQPVEAVPESKTTFFTLRRPDVVHLNRLQNKQYSAGDVLPCAVTPYGVYGFMTVSFATDEGQYSIHGVRKSERSQVGFWHEAN